MVRIKYYEKIEEIFNNYDEYMKMSLINPLRLRALTRIINSKLPRYNSSYQIEKRQKELIDKLILTYGLTCTLVK